MVVFALTVVKCFWWTARHAWSYNLGGLLVVVCVGLVSCFISDTRLDDIKDGEKSDYDLFGKHSTVRKGGKERTRNERVVLMS